MTSDSVHLVTGAASGIGREVVCMLLEKGVRVVASDIDDKLFDYDYPPRRVLVERLDVTCHAAWRRVVAAAVEQFGRLDVVYNVAGFLAPGWVRELDPADVDRHFDINVKGVIHGTRVAAEHMIERGSGHIINVASMAAYAPIPGLSLYSASKYAVRAFSLAAAHELEPDGVAVTVLCPDACITPMLDKQRHSDEAALTFTAPRILTAREVAAQLTGPILTERPLEIAMPRSRKWLARVVDLAPRLSRHIAPLMQRQGRAKQQRHGK